MTKPLISIVQNSPDLWDLNRRYRIELGNTVFKTVSEDELDFYVIAENVSFEEKIVKYYQ